MKGIIFDIKRYSIHDGPGIRTTVFLKGCPLRCLWCHNPESQDLKPRVVWYASRCLGCLDCVDTCEYEALSYNGLINIDTNRCSLCLKCVDNCPSKALEVIGKEYEAEKLVDELLRDSIFFSDEGGITISGGEPFVQADFLFELLELIKQSDVHIALDTTGYTNRDNILKSLEYVDLFLYDLKIMDCEKHKSYTGVKNDTILDNLVLLDQNNAQISIRIPIIPEINDDMDNIEKTIDFISSLKNVVSVDLLPFHNIMVDKYKRLKIPFLLSNIKQPDDEEMLRIKEIFEKAKFKVNVGG